MVAHPTGKTSPGLCGIQTALLSLGFEMPSKSLVLLALFSLLAACSSDAPKPVASATPPPTAAPVIKAPVELGPLPAYQRQLSGNLLGVPTGAEVEMALLVIDSRARPQKLLASAKQRGTGQPLPFQLRFAAEAFPAGSRVELRARASQSGQLILHLPAVQINQPTTQLLGNLEMIKAP
ncbi:hypothetical protein AHFPHNDE_03696 [Pseudomonas sp. MM227]|nr:hypothetical protein AHFPHNDE_03696 [Pseudomonas sp. MM227]